MVNSKELLLKVLNEKPGRSTWAKGVRVAALWLVARTINENPGKIELCNSTKDLELVLLNGAGSWHDYSWGGCALIYDQEIAALYCTPSEWKKTRGGERKPNRREEWLDVQARALRQAAHLACECFLDISRGAQA